MSFLGNFFNKTLGIGQQGTIAGTVGEWFQGPNPHSAAGKQRTENVLSREHATAERLASEAFNASQAEINRNFQKEMSDTSYQRMIKDLEKAGINPALALSQGGASTPSGAVASSHASPSGASSTKTSGGMSLVVPLMMMMLTGVSSGAKLAMASAKQAQIGTTLTGAANATKAQLAYAAKSPAQKLALKHAGSKANIANRQPFNWEREMKKLEMEQKAAKAAKANSYYSSKRYL